MWNGKMVDYYIKKYVEKDEYEPWQIESIRYSLLSIMLELEKWIVLICLFSILGMEYDFLIFAICLLCVRIYHGGLHMKTYTGCLIYSILYFLINATIAFASKQEGIYNVLPQYNPLNATECGAP